MNNRGAGSTEALARLPSHTSKVARPHAACGRGLQGALESDVGSAEEAGVSRGSGRPESAEQTGGDAAGSVAAVNVNQISSVIRTTCLDSRLIGPATWPRLPPAPRTRCPLCEPCTIPEDGEAHQTAKSSPHGPLIFIGREGYPPVIAASGKGLESRLALIDRVCSRFMYGSPLTARKAGP